jgi:hypothetical protein
MAKSDVLSENAFIVCESGVEDVINGNEEISSFYDIYKKARYSVSYITILKLKEKDTF